MRLELAVGEIQNVSDIDSINKALDSLSEDNDHAILGDGDYIQTAWSGGGLFLVEYSDGSGYFRSTDEKLKLPLVKQLFEGFFKDTSDWKNLTQWTLESEAETAGSSSDYSNTSSTGKSSGNFKDDLVEGLKRDAVNWGKRKLKRFLKF
ncbi:MAG: hypothetical protein KAR21_16405 [Spirochaetales bacterium]|nr:hypothetical protein [Spirochaetales bacterium]